MATTDDRDRRLPKFVLDGVTVPAVPSVPSGRASTAPTATSAPSAKAGRIYPDTFRLYDENTSAEGAARKAFTQAGGGGPGYGASVVEQIKQSVARPVQYVANDLADAAKTLAYPVEGFLRGAVGAVIPSAPAGVNAARDSGRVPNYPTLRTVISPGQEATAPALDRTPSRGQPVPVVQPVIPPEPDPRRDQKRATQADQNFDINNVPQGGGFISFDQPLSADRLARMSPELRAQAQTGAIRITPDRAKELAGQGTTVPAGAIAQMRDGGGSVGGVFGGGGLQQQVFGAQGSVPSGQLNAPRRSTLIGDRSQDFDSVLKNLVAQATREPDSYGELFRRKGVLNALNDIAGVATSAGTNAAQDIANVRSAVEQRLDTELTDQSREADRGVTTRGQDRLFQSGLLQNTIAARNADLQATTARDVAADRNAVLREGQKSRSADSAAQRASQERIYAGAAERELGSNPLRQLDAQIIKRVNADGTPMTEEGLVNALALRDRLQAQANPYQFLLPQAQ